MGRSGWGEGVLGLKGHMWGDGTTQVMFGERAPGLWLEPRDELGRVRRDLERQLQSWDLASLGWEPWKVSDPGRE